MGVLGTLLDYNIEISDSFLMHAYHLVSFCSLVYIVDFPGDQLDALRQREYGFLKLFKPAVGDSYMVEYIWFVGRVSLLLQAIFKTSETPLVLLERKIS